MSYPGKGPPGLIGELLPVLLAVVAGSTAAPAAPRPAAVRFEGAALLRGEWIERPGPGAPFRLRAAEAPGEGATIEKLDARRPERFPLWGWKPVEVDVFRAPSGRMSLELEAPPGEHLVSLELGEYDEGESAFELSIDGRDDEVLRSPMPEAEARGRPFAVHRLVTVSGTLRIRIRKRPSAGGSVEGMSLAAVEVTPRAEAAARSVELLAEARRIFGEPFYYERVALPHGRMLQVIDLAARAEPLLDGEPLRDARVLGFKARYWITAESRWSRSSEEEAVAWASDVARRYPEDPDVKRYLSSWALGYPSSDGGMPALPLLLALRYRSAGEPWTAPGGEREGPAWARRLHAVLGKLAQVGAYWSERQRSDGQLGGRLDDDVEVLRNLALLAIARSDAGAARVYRRVADALWTSGQIEGGYLKGFRDVEHASEYVADSQCPSFLLEYPAPDMLGRMREAAACLPVWVRPNEKGSWLFRSVFFDARGFATDARSANDVPRGRDDVVTDGFDTFYNIQAAAPAVWRTWHERSPELEEALGRWLRSWHGVASQPWRNRPAGAYPAIIRFSDEAQACRGGSDFLEPGTGFDYYDEWQGNWPWMQLALSLYLVTGDASFLSMIEDSIRAVRAGPGEDRTSARVHGELREQCGWIYPFWRAEVDKADHDDLFPEEARWAARGSPAGWGDALESSRKGVEEAAGVVLAATEFNFAMFTREVVYTDRAYVRGLEWLEPVVHGLPSWRGFVLPLFRAVVSPGDDVVHTALVTPRDTIALLVHSFAAEPREVTVKPLHLPAGKYTAEVYAASRLDRPEETRDVDLAARMTPVRLTVPPRRESLLVIRPYRGKRS